MLRPLNAASAPNAVVAEKSVVAVVEENALFRLANAERLRAHARPPKRYRNKQYDLQYDFLGGHASSSADGMALAKFTVLHERSMRDRRRVSVHPAAHTRHRN